MQHEIFALFDSVEEADAAIGELEKSPLCEGSYSVVMHKKALHAADTELPETKALAGLRVGGMLGAAGGALLGALAAGPAELVGGGPAFTALFGGVYLGVFGALAGFLGGSSTADKRLAKLAHAIEKEGKVLVSAEVSGLTCTEVVKETFIRHGATLDHPALLAL